MAQTAEVIELLADSAGQSIHNEALSAAASAIVPGDMVEELAAGTVQEQSTAGARAQKLFALTNLGNGSDIDEAYAVGETVRYGAFHSGQEVFARVAAGAPAIVIGDELDPAGDGTLKKIAADVAGAQAVLTVGAGNSQVLFTAADIGEEGNDITVEYLSATAATATVVVTDLAIVIKPDSTTGGTTDLASTVIALVNADAAAQALVVASIGTGDGTGIVVSPAAEANLAGGINTSGPVYPTAVAQEAVDNSGGGSTVRIKVRVA